MESDVGLPGPPSDWGRLESLMVNDDCDTTIDFFNSNLNVDILESELEDTGDFENFFLSLKVEPTENLYHSNEVPTSDQHNEQQYTVTKKPKPNTAKKTKKEENVIPLENNIETSPKCDIKKINNAKVKNNVCHSVPKISECSNNTASQNDFCQLTLADLVKMRKRSCNERTSSNLYTNQRSVQTSNRNNLSKKAKDLSSKTSSTLPTINEATVNKVSVVEKEINNASSARSNREKSKKEHAPKLKHSSKAISKKQRSALITSEVEETVPEKTKKSIPEANSSVASYSLSVHSEESAKIKSPKNSCEHHPKSAISSTENEAVKIHISDSEDGNSRTKDTQTCTSPATTHLKNETKSSSKLKVEPTEHSTGLKLRISRRDNNYESYVISVDGSYPVSKEGDSHSRTSETDSIIRKGCEKTPSNEIQNEGTTKTLTSKKHKKDSHSKISKKVNTAIDSSVYNVSVVYDNIDCDSKSSVINFKGSLQEDKNDESALIIKHKNRNKSNATIKHSNLIFTDENLFAKQITAVPKINGHKTKKHTNKKLANHHRDNHISKVENLTSDDSNSKELLLASTSSYEENLNYDLPDFENSQFICKPSEILSNRLMLNHDEHSQEFEFHQSVSISEDPFHQLQISDVSDLKSKTLALFEQKGFKSSVSSNISETESSETKEIKSESSYKVVTNCADEFMSSHNNDIVNDSTNRDLQSPIIKVEDNLSFITSHLKTESSYCQLSSSNLSDDADSSPDEADSHNSKLHGAFNLDTERLLQGKNSVNLSEVSSSETDDGEIPLDDELTIQIENTESEMNNVDASQNHFILKNEDLKQNCLENLNSVSSCLEKSQSSQTSNSHSSVEDVKIKIESDKCLSPFNKSTVFTNSPHNHERLKLNSLSTDDLCDQNSSHSRLSFSSTNSANGSSSLVQQRKIPSKPRQYRKQRSSSRESSDCSSGSEIYERDKNHYKRKFRRSRSSSKSSSKHTYNSRYDIERSRSPPNSVRRTDGRKFSSHNRWKDYHSYSRKYSSSPRSRSRSPCRRSPRRTSQRRSRSPQRWNKTSRSRSRSPVRNNRSSRRWNRNHRSRSPRHRNRSPLKNREKRDSYNNRYSRHERKEKADERKVLYVGRIPSTFTTSDLKERFSRFGFIEEASIHRPETKQQYNFGFVTFKHTEDAVDAYTHGNDGFELKFTISFGGRKDFCGYSYLDLDHNNEVFEENNGYLYQRPEATNDFDSLLQAEVKRVEKQKKH